MSVPNLHIRSMAEKRKRTRMEVLKSLDIIEHELAKLRVIADEYHENSPMPVHIVRHGHLRMVSGYVSEMAEHALEFKP